MSIELAKTLDAYELCHEILKERFENRQNRMLSRAEFVSRKQLEGESCAEFTTTLRRLAATSDFDNITTDEMVKTKFILGLRSRVARQKLLLDGESLTLQEAMSLAIRVEKNMADMGAGSSGVARMESPSLSQQPWRQEVVFSKVPWQVEFAEVFRDEISVIKGFQHKVKMRKMYTAKQHKLRRLPMAIRDEVKSEIDALSDKGIIESVEASEFVSGMVVVKKKNGKLRICVDLRDVNEAIVPDVFPLPHMDEIFVGLQGARWFSKLDARSAYHHVELHEESRDLTTFITPWGLFRYKRVCFGLSSAPAAFQRIMKLLFEGLEGVLIYLDDILVYVKDREEHDARLRRVLD